MPGVARVETVEQGPERTVARAYAGGAERGSSLAARIAAALTLAHWNLLGVTAEEGRLDDVFRAITHSDVTRMEGGAA